MEETSFTIPKEFFVPSQENHSEMQYLLYNQYEIPMQEGTSCITQCSGVPFIENKQKNQGALIFTTNNSLKIVALNLNKQIEIDVPFKNKLPISLDVKSSSLSTMEIAIGYADGRVYTFDSRSRAVNTIKKYNLVEPDEIRKNSKVILIKWIGDDGHKLAVVFEDRSIHVISDLTENHKHQDPSLANKIYYNMRLVEKTRTMNEVDDLVIYSDYTFPNEIANLKYFPCYFSNNISDFTAVENNDLSINPLSIWQFYCKEITDIRFFPELLNSGNTAIVLASKDNYLRIYDYENHCLIKMIKGFYGYFTCIEFSSDGLLLAAGCISNIIILFETTNFCPLQILNGLKSIPNCIKFDNTFTLGMEEIKSNEKINFSKNLDFLLERPYDFVSSDLIIQYVANHFTYQYEGCRMYRIVGVGEDCCSYFWNFNYEQSFDLIEKKSRNYFSQMMDKINYTLPSLYQLVQNNYICGIKLSNNSIVHCENISSFVCFSTKNNVVAIYKPINNKNYFTFKKDAPPPKAKETTIKEEKKSKGLSTRNKGKRSESKNERKILKTPMEKKIKTKEKEKDKQTSISPEKEKGKAIEKGSQSTNKEKHKQIKEIKESKTDQKLKDKKEIKEQTKLMEKAKADESKKMEEKLKKITEEKLKKENDKLIKEEQKRQKEKEKQEKLLKKQNEIDKIQSEKKEKKEKLESDKMEKEKLKKKKEDDRIENEKIKKVNKEKEKQEKQEKERLRKEENEKKMTDKKKKKEQTLIDKDQREQEKAKTKQALEELKEQDKKERENQMLKKLEEKQAQSEKRKKEMELKAKQLKSFGEEKLHSIEQRRQAQEQLEIEKQKKKEKVRKAIEEFKKKKEQMKNLKIDSNKKSRRYIESEVDDLDLQGLDEEDIKRIKKAKAFYLTKNFQKEDNSNRNNSERQIFYQSNLHEDSDFHRCLFCDLRDKEMEEYKLQEKFEFLREDRAKIIKLKKGVKKVTEEDNLDNLEVLEEELQSDNRATTANKFINKFEPVLGDKYHEELENMDEEEFIKWLTIKRENDKTKFFRQTNFNNNYREKSLENKYREMVIRNNKMIQNKFSKIFVKPNLKNIMLNSIGRYTSLPPLSSQLCLNLNKNSLRKYKPQVITPRKESLIVINNVPIDKEKSKGIIIKPTEDMSGSLGTNRNRVSSPFTLDLKKVCDPLLRQYEEIFLLTDKKNQPDLFIVDQENFNFNPNQREEVEENGDQEEKRTSKIEDFQSFAKKHSINTSKAICQSHDRFKKMVQKCKIFAPYMKKGKLYVFQQEQTKLVINPETLTQGFLVK